MREGTKTQDQTPGFPGGRERRNHPSWKRGGAVSFLSYAFEAALLFYILLLPVPGTSGLRSASVVVMLVSWIGRMVLERAQGFVRGNLFLPFLIFASAGLLSSIISEDLHESVREYRHEMLMDLFLYFAVVNNLNRRSAKRVILFFALPCAGYSLFGLGKYILTYPAEADHGLKAFFSIHTRFAMVFVLFLPVVLAAAVLHRGPWKRLSLCAAFLLGIAVLFLSKCRSAMAAVLASLALFGILVNRWIVLALVFVSIVMFLFIPRETLSHYFTILDIGDYSRINGVLKERPLYWEGAVKLIRERPLLGFGYGRKIFQRVFKERFPGEYKEYPFHAHNVPVEILFEMGIVGLAAFLILFARVLWDLGRSIRNRSRPDVRLLAVGILSAIAGLAIFGMVDWTYSRSVSKYLWILISTGEVFSRSE